MAQVVVPCTNPECKARYRVEEATLGRQVRCKKCGTTFVLRGTDGPASRPTVATPPAGGRERPCGEDGIPRDWEPGDVILDLYEVVNLPGTTHGYAEGGMGRVNLVRHREWQKDLAVKSVLPAKSASARDIENFKTEAEQWVEKIGLHPNIVACQYVRVLGGLPRVFIDYVDGGSLQEWVTSKRLYEGGPRAALGRILDVAIQTAWGLHYVHGLGLIHQDVKPLNVMMTADGVARVTDFGLAGARSAAFAEEGPAPAGATLLATWGGMTPAYCSPEQAEVAALRKAGTPREQLPKLTRRTDMWSWAASVLHLFLGSVAWPVGQVAHVGLQHEPEGPHLPALPPAVKELLGKCLRKRPEDRPHDLMQTAEALRCIYGEVIGHPYAREQPRPEDLLADSLNNRAVSLFDLGKKAEAEMRWQEALRVEPHHPETTFNWGLTQWRSLRLTDQKLLQKLREVRTSCRESARVDYLLGLAHLERTDARAAVEVLSKAVAAGTGRAEISSALALAQSLVNPAEQLPRALNENWWDVMPQVSWSPDGRYALSGSRGGALRLWEVASGQCLRTFQGNSPESMVFPETLEADINGQKNRVTSVSWSPDGRYALSGSGDRTLRQWEVSTGRCLRTFEGHTETVTSASWSPDGRYALSGSWDRTLRLWEVASGRCLRSFEGHTGQVLSVSWSPDGRYALSGSDDTTLRFWEVASGQCLRTFEGHTLIVTSVSWSPDGRYALSGSWDHTLRLWDVATGQCLRAFEGHTNTVTSVSWSPDGRYALSGSDGGPPQLWGIALRKQPIPLVTGMALAGNSGLYHNLLQQVRDSRASNPAIAAGLLRQARQQPGCSRREDSLLLARQLSRSLAHRRFVGGWDKRTFAGHTDGVNSVSWSPDGRYALSGSKDKTLRLWDVATGQCLRTFKGHIREVTQVSWSPDGRYALSGNAYKTLRLWEVASGRCLRSFEGHTSSVLSVSWGPDGRHALSGSGDHTLRLWEMPSGQCLRTFKGDTPAVTQVSWSPDGRHALSGHSYDGTLRLWEVSSGQCLRCFKGHPSKVLSVSWSPDGRYALSGSKDYTLRLWDMATGQCLRAFEGHTDAVTSVSWSPDGRHALSGSKDKTLRLWELDWEFELNHPADWDEKARPFLIQFLTLHTPYAEGLLRRGKPTWTEDDFRRLLDKLGCAGFGWLRPEGVRRELQDMAATWQGPPPLVP